MASRVHKLFKSDGQPFTVFIEGNIGSGKTTFLNHFKKHEGVCLQTEPVDKWRNLGGVNLLVRIFLVYLFCIEIIVVFCIVKDLMYKEPDRWAMPFQTYVTLTMLQTHTMATEKSVKLMERSIYSARFVQTFIPKLCCFLFIIFDIDTVLWRRCVPVAFCTKQCTILCKNGINTLRTMCTFKQIWLVCKTRFFF